MGRLDFSDGSETRDHKGEGSKSKTDGAEGGGGGGGGGREQSQSLVAEWRALERQVEERESELRKLRMVRTCRAKVESG